MAKKILVITSSLRTGSNSDALAAEFIRGAGAAGHAVEHISLKGKEIAYCCGCLACAKLGRCVIEDDAAAIAEKVEHADVIVFATPIYYYNISGQLKTLIDRLNPLYPKQCAFRDVYLICTGDEDGERVYRRAADSLQGWIDCHSPAKLSGILFAGNLFDPEAVKGSEKLQEAYRMGLSC